MLKVITIPDLTDNYIWMLANSENSEAIVVDPGEAPQVINALKEKNLKLKAILLTHKHKDHVGGVDEILQYQQVPVFGSELDHVPCMTHHVVDGQILHFEHWPKIKVFSIPGHTLGHTMYLVENCLFCGDTLFGAGCGRLFEGTAEQMLASLEKIKSLPDDTRIYCGHEYTLKNLGFAQMLEPKNQEIETRIKHTENLRIKAEPSVPSTLMLEKATNPFLRCNQKDIQAKAAEYAKQMIVGELEAFKAIRAWRNTY